MKMKNILFINLAKRSKTEIFLIIVISFANRIIMNCRENLINQLIRYKWLLIIGWSLKHMHLSICLVSYAAQVAYASIRAVLTYGPTRALQEKDGQVRR